MRHHLLTSPLTTMSSSSTTSKTPNFKKTRSNPNPNPNPNCHHSASTTLDLLILLLVLFSGTFLISSYFSYTLHSLSLLLPVLEIEARSLSLFVLILLCVTACFVFRKCGFRRKCSNVGCKGLRKAREIDLRLQSEECLREGGKEVMEVDELPWRGGEGCVEFECLRNELRKMAPVNGRAVLVFQRKCGCAFAKLEGWSLKRGGRKNKKALTLKGGGDHR